MPGFNKIVVALAAHAAAPFVNASQQVPNELCGLMLLQMKSDSKGSDEDANEELEDFDENAYELESMDENAYERPAAMAAAVNESASAKAHESQLEDAIEESKTAAEYYNLTNVDLTNVAKNAMTAADAATPIVTVDKVFADANLRGDEKQDELLQKLHSEVKDLRKWNLNQSRDIASLKAQRQTLFEKLSQVRIQEKFDRQHLEDLRSGKKTMEEVKAERLAENDADYASAKAKLANLMEANVTDEANASNATQSFNDKVGSNRTNETIGMNTSSKLA